MSEILYIPFGLSIAAATFQRFISALKPSQKQVFQRFEEYGGVLNASKSVVGETSVKFLGHVVTAEGISPLPEKAAANTSFSKPETVKELRRFLAHCNFLKNFIPNAARTQSMLNDYLKRAKKYDRTPNLYSEESAAAFEKCKKDLAYATVLYRPSSDASLAIVVD
ncbi:retrovirus-related Pol polyprotein from transposon 17.6 [Trichonephila clavata]|uniref:Retrovirus-related Pol polyprotein from transposon 17.6 n=1 Tax=Trichonephila clavata TaxID=2740835 RepID=A0A8X6JBJ2_TRICU|nr:retrovirus-related Pol polyprotein from transposon 17.6 [Trichonephila clavata]